METPTMGRVVVAAQIENLSDLYEVRKGAIAQAAVRRIDVADALVDTGATTLCLPPRLIAQLGLNAGQVRRVRTAGGSKDFAMYDAVRLTVQGRDCTVDVAEVAEDCPVLIGQVPLELLDFVVDPKGQRLIGNPEHGGEQMFELYTILPPRNG